MNAIAMIEFKGGRKVILTDSTHDVCDDFSVCKCARTFVAIMREMQYPTTTGRGLRASLGVWNEIHNKLPRN